MNPHTDTAVLSGAILKDRAKELLSGKYGKAVLACFLIGLISMGCQLLVEFIVGILFVIVILIRETMENGLTPEQMAYLVEQTNFIESYQIWYDGLAYIGTLITSMFTGVFSAGLCLFCLNLACGRQIHISDIFYGFRCQFGKTFKLAAVMALLGELYGLPTTILNYLIRKNTPLGELIPLLFVFAVGVAIYIPLSLSVSQSFLLLLDFPGYSAGELLKLSTHIMQGHKGRLFRIQLSFLPLLLLGILSFGIGNLWLAPYMDITYTLFFLNLMQTRDSLTR